MPKLIIFARSKADKKIHPGSEKGVKTDETLGSYLRKEHKRISALPWAERFNQKNGNYVSHFLIDMIVFILNYVHK